MKSHFLFTLICASCVAGLYVQPAMADSNTELSIINAILRAQSNAPGASTVGPSQGGGGVIPWRTLKNEGTGSGSLVAIIGGQAFSGLSGILQLNQASGDENLEANTAAIGLGSATTLTSITLNQQFAQPGPGAPSSDSGSGLKKVSISSQAFDHANGVLQVSQAAGIGNRLANEFSLQIR